MIELFRKNIFFNVILLLPYTIAIRIRSFIDPQVYIPDSEDTFISHFIFTHLVDFPLLSSCIAILLIYIEAVFINILTNTRRIASEQTLIPGLLYILGMSFLPQYLVLNPVNMSMLFLVISLFFLLSTYKATESADAIFDVAFFNFLATLIYHPSILFLVAGFIGLILMQSFRIKEKIQYLLGVIIPIFLFVTALYWTGNLNDIGVGKTYFNLGIVGQIFSIEGRSMTILGIVFFLTIFVSVSFGTYVKKKSIPAQKKIQIFYWYLFLSWVSLILCSEFDLYHLQLLNIPFSLFLGMSLLFIQNRMTLEIIHLLLLIGIFILHF